MSSAITPQELAAINRPIHDAHGLPNRFYTEHDAAAAERDSVLTDTWVCIGFAADLQPGHAQPIDFMGVPLAVVHAPGGEIRVFHNVCRHRGHRLITSTRPLEGAIRCPYHSWTYGFDGSLRGTPHIGGHGIHSTPQFDKSLRGLFPVRSAVWLDMLFVNLNGNAPEFSDHINPLVQRWEQFVGPNGLDALRPAKDDGALQLMVDCNWKLAVENYCESYHLPWIHPTLNSYSKIQDHYNIVAGNWGSGQGTRVFDFASRAGISLPRFPLWPEDKLRIAEYIAFFPNILLGLQNDHFFVIQLHPETAGRTVENVRLYYIGEAATNAASRNARQVVREGWKSVFAEDIGVCQEMQIGRISPAFDGGAFSPALDVATHFFHQWVANRLPMTA